MSEHKEHHEHPGYGQYALIWLCLMALTGLTVAASGINLGAAVNIALAMIIATVKVTLVLLFFMHLRYEGIVIRTMFFVAIAIYLTMMLLTFVDYPFRDVIL